MTTEQTPSSRHAGSAAEPTDYPFGPPCGFEMPSQYRELRRSDPIIRVRSPFGEDGWLLTRHEDVKTVLGDQRFSREAVRVHDEPRMLPDSFTQGLISMDPPDHTRLRGVVTKAFTARRVEQLRPRIRELALQLANAMIADGPPADLVEDFGIPLPISVISELLGVPAKDRETFGAWSDAVYSTTALPADTRREYLINLYHYIGELVEIRRKSPESDLLSALVKTQEEGNVLSNEEIYGFGVAILVGGFETLAAEIPNFVYTLLKRPDDAALLRSRPDLIPNAVEELLRHVPLGTGAMFARYATEDVEICGTTVKAGEPVLPSALSANRDENVFPEPDEIRFDRTANPHMTFGHGPHFCLGAQLARIELQVAVEVILETLPTLRLAASDDDLVWRSGSLVRGPVSLPVAW